MDTLLCHWGRIYEFVSHPFSGERVHSLRPFIYEFTTRSLKYGELIYGFRSEQTDDVEVIFSR